MNNNWFKLLHKKMVGLFRQLIENKTIKKKDSNFEEIIHAINYTKKGLALLENTCLRMKKNSLFKNIFDLWSN